MPTMIERTVEVFESPVYLLRHALTRSRLYSEADLCSNSNSYMRLWWLYTGLAANGVGTDAGYYYGRTDTDTYVRVCIIVSLRCFISFSSYQNGNIIIWNESQILMA